MRVFLATIAVAALVALAAPAAFAHTPQNCVALFHEAAKLNQAAVRVGQRVFKAADDMLESRSGSHRDRYRRYDSGRVEQVADLLAQFAGWLTDRDLAIAKAVKCVDGQK